jgi:RNA polymerase sigma factor (sigma-70 family)
MAASLLLLARQVSPPTIADGELLERFVRFRDNEAFTELVRRHGPVVYRICRRLVGTAAADDAFQATFLLLATRSAAASAANSVGGWLVGVAGRVARQTRRAAQRRLHYESNAACRTQVESNDSAPELLDQFRILDEELARLPDRLRDPLVSCLLQGRTQEEAATESGHTARTVRRRLEEAKRLLRLRLQRRGVTPAVAVGLVAGLESISAAVPLGLIGRTVVVVFDFLTGGSVITSPPLVLARGVATTMLARKVMASMVAVALGLTTLGIVLAEDPQSNPPASTTKAVFPPPLPAQAAPPSAASPPIQEPPLPESKGPADKLPEELERQLRQLEKSLKPGEQQLVIESKRVRVSAGFCEEAGLADNPKMLFWASLNRREVKMLEALIRAKPDREILTLPRIVVPDGKAGSVKAGEDIQVITYEATDDVKKNDDLAKLKKLRTNSYPRLALDFTPKTHKDSGDILLRVDIMTGQQGAAIKTDKTITVPSINTYSFDTTVTIRSGGTAVIGDPIESTQDKTKKNELLWIVTAHLVRGKP